MNQPAIAKGFETDTGSIVVKPLSPALGAEIVGIDLREEPSAQTVAAILDAWHQHLVIVFRDQKLTEDEQIRFAKHFGVLKTRNRPASARNESGVQHGDLTMLVSNIRENGKLIGSLADGEMNFHSDYCYLEKPAKGTFLYAIEIPSQGGDTLFLNMHKAYDALPAELKARVEGRKAVNAYHYESLTRSVNEAKIDFSKQPHFWQPMVCRHPVTGR
jgi:taurine dioxygenase